MAFAPEQLPFAPTPIGDELLSSWLLRVADANFVSLSELLKGFEARYARVPRSWLMDYSLPEATVTALSAFCRVTASSIRALDLRHHAHHLHPPLLLRFQNDSPLDPRCRVRRVRYGFCPVCIREQATLFVRWDWSVTFLVRCALHMVLLQDGCPVCGDLDPLPLSSAALLPNRCCQACGSKLTVIDKETKKNQTHAKREVQRVENTYRAVLMGAQPNPALLGQTTDKAFRQFIEDLLLLLTRRLMPAGPKGPALFDRQDIVHIITTLILNAAPNANQSVRSKHYKQGLILWATLLSLISPHEGADIEQASVRWPLALRRRFLSALHSRTRKRWPFNPYQLSRNIGKRISRSDIAFVYGIRPKPLSVASNVQNPKL
jgi:hypothetical protein